jgi:hypothetical protein
MENSFSRQLDLVVTFRFCVVTRTNFCDGAEDFGEEIFRAMRERCEVRLIWKLFIAIVKQGFLSGGF